VAKTYSEDTIVFSCLTPEFSDTKVLYELLRDFFNKKKEIDYNDRFNGIVFTKRGPQYLEDFTLNPENILNAIKFLEPHLKKGNIAGGIFVALTFVAEVFKRISGKVFRLIILIDSGSSKIQEDHIFFLEDLLDKVKDIPFIMDAIAINTFDPKEELRLMKLCRRTGGDIYEVNVDFEKIKELPKQKEFEETEEPPNPTILERINKLSRSPLKIARKLRGDQAEEEEQEDINPLATIFEKLAKKKEIKYGIIDQDTKIEIPEKNILFFESLADKLLEIEPKKKQKCTICFTSVSKNLQIMQCPYCLTHIHKICAAIWAKTSHIASNTPHLFRCHNCYNLIRMDEDFCSKVNDTKTPMIELFGMEDIVLEEYLEKIESEKDPKLISTEDEFSISIQEDEVDLIMRDEVEIVWCPNCGKMTSNEFLKCPQCGHPLKEEKSVIEEIKVSEGLEPATQEKEEEEIPLTDIEEEAKRIINEIQEKFSYIKKKFKTLTEQNKVEDAYKVVREFKDSNQNVLEDLGIEEINTFFNEVEDFWEEYTTTNKEFLEQKRLIEEEEKRIQRKKDQLEKIQEVMSKSSELAKEFQFDEALTLLNETHEEIDIEELMSYKEKLFEKREEIQEAKDSYELLNNEFLKLAESFKKNYIDNNLSLAFNQSKKLSKMAEELGNIDLVQEYNKKALHIQKKIEDIKSQLGKLFKEGLDLLEKEDIAGAFKKIKDISEFVVDDFEWD